MPQAKPSRKSAAAKKKSTKAPSRSAKTAARVAPAQKKDRARSNKNRPPRTATLEEVAAGDREVTIDRRRAESQQPEMAAAVAPPLERRKKVHRRRQIDPTTCERDYTDQEVEFMNAIDEYKRKSGRMFPTCSEVLEVVRSLGYVKMPVAITIVQDGSMPAPAELPSTVEDTPASNL
jgi:hypothetical protein